MRLKDKNGTPLRGFVPKPNDFLLHGIIRNNWKRLRIFLEQKDARARILYDPHCKKRNPRRSAVA